MEFDAHPVTVPAIGRIVAGYREWRSKSQKRRGVLTRTKPSGKPDYSGNKLAQAPSTSLTLSADWRKPLGDNELTLHWDSNYRSTMFFDPSNNPYTAQPSYWLHNARISFSLKDGRYELGAFARNLTKKEYLVWNADLSDPFGVLTAIVGTPRIFGVDFNYKY